MGGMSSLLIEAQGERGITLTLTPTLTLTLTLTLGIALARSYGTDDKEYREEALRSPVRIKTLEELREVHERDTDPYTARKT